jgi:predicted  nucleic acid-binding Zn-ribbon protein
VSFIRTGFREIALKVKRQRTRMALRYERRLLQKSEINLGREGTAQAANFPELRNEIVALKKLEQEQKEVALRIAQIEEGIKKLEDERQQNTHDQNAAIAKLEAEKKPLLQRRNQAKSTADVCERELAAVERRIQESEAADRDLLKQLSNLQAVNPPPSDLEARSASISAQRARLPEERAELVRARMGSTDAARLAREKLTAAEAELSVVEKNMERVRTEFEARDRKLNDNIRAQQEAVREARAQHQTVEERKNPAYLNIGRHLAAQGIAPPNAPHLLTEAHRRREAVDRHLQHRAELALLSSQIDKQELRRFYFSAVSVIALLAIILPVTFQSPRKREWLPQETDTILSINTDQFERADLPKRWRKDQPKIWPKLWSGLIGPAVSTPGLELPRDAVRITRAASTDDSGRTREFVLVEARRDVSRAVRVIAGDKSFEKRTISGLPVWERPPDFAVARVGPATLAVGALNEVDELVLVRLGMKPDLKITGQLFDRLQALDRESALRLISRNPPDLSRVFHPIFARELLDVSHLLGLALSLQNPVKAKLLLKLESPERVAELTRNFHDAPQQWLRLSDSQLLLYSQPPEIQKQGNSNLELRFTVPEESARLLLERIGKTDAAEVVATP